MSLPQSLAEYETRFRENVGQRRQEGEPKISIPCPFCAARDWYVVSLEEFRHSTTAIYCPECERSARLISSEDGVQMELVQVAGPGAPSWLPTVRHENPRVVSKGHLDPSKKSKGGRVR